MAFNLVKCPNGHYFDSAQFKVCPQCGAAGEGKNKKNDGPGMTVEIMGINDRRAESRVEEVVDDGSAEQYVNPYRQKIVNNSGKTAGNAPVRNNSEGMVTAVIKEKPEEPADTQVLGLNNSPSGHVSAPAPPPAPIYGPPDAQQPQPSAPPPKPAPVSAPPPVPVQVQENPQPVPQPQPVQPSPVIGNVPLMPEKDKDDDAIFQTNILDDPAVQSQLKETRDNAPPVKTINDTPQAAPAAAESRRPQQPAPPPVKSIFPTRQENDKPVQRHIPASPQPEKVVSPQSAGNPNAGGGYDNSPLSAYKNQYEDMSGQDSRDSFDDIVGEQKSRPSVQQPYGDNQGSQFVHQSFPGGSGTPGSQQQYPGGNVTPVNQPPYPGGSGTFGQPPYPGSNVSSFGNPPYNGGNGMQPGQQYGQQPFNGGNGMQPGQQYGQQPFNGGNGMQSGQQGGQMSYNGNNRMSYGQPNADNSGQQFVQRQQPLYDDQPHYQNRMNPDYQYRSIPDAGSDGGYFGSSPSYYNQMYSGGRQGKQPEPDLEKAIHDAAVTKVQDSYGRVQGYVKPSVQAQAQSYDDDGGVTMEIEPYEPARNLPVGFLIVLNGEKAGKVFTLFAGENGIGRNGKGNKFDIDMSFNNKIHRSLQAKVIYSAQTRSFSIIPNKVGDERMNKIVVNGAPLDRHIFLRNYDRIMIESSVMMLVAVCGEAFSWGNM